MRIFSLPRKNSSKSIWNVNEIGCANVSRNGRAAITAVWEEFGAVH